MVMEVQLEAGEEELLMLEVKLQALLEEQVILSSFSHHLVTNPLVVMVEGWEYLNLTTVLEVLAPKAILVFKELDSTKVGYYLSIAIKEQFKKTVDCFTSQALILESWNLSSLDFPLLAIQPCFQAYS